jgi:hypothetical protein
MVINNVNINNTQVQFFNGVGYKQYPPDENGTIRLQSDQHNPRIFITRDGKIEMHSNMKVDYSLRKGEYSNMNDVVKDIIRKENLHRWTNFAK